MFAWLGGGTTELGWRVICLWGIAGSNTVYTPNHTKISIRPSHPNTLKKVTLTLPLAVLMDESSWDWKKGFTYMAWSVAWRVGGLWWEEGCRSIGFELSQHSWGKRGGGGRL